MVGLFGPRDPKCCQNNIVSMFFLDKEPASNSQHLEMPVLSSYFKVFVCIAPVMCDNT